jgi:hypothetical protein
VDNSKGSDAAASALVDNKNVYSVEEYTYKALDFDPNYIAELEIIDGAYDVYSNEVNKTVGKLTYKRSLSNTDLKALYVPFAIPVESLTNLGIQVAYINDFRSYDADGNKKLVLESVLMTEGTLKPNHPYLFRYAADDYVKPLELVIENAKLFSTDAENQTTVDCSSVYMTFTVRGTYTTMDHDDLNGARILGGGNVWGPLAEGYSLTPFRLYLSITDRGGSPIMEGISNTVAVRILGADGTTVIEDVEMSFDCEDMIFDLQGRRVLETEKGGIYIKNGKKFIAQ